MKKWMKRLLITAAVMAAVGLLLLGTGLIMGGVQGLEAVSLHYSEEKLLDLPAPDNRYEIDPQGIENLEISWVAGDLTVQYWEGDTVVLQESSRKPLTARTRVGYEVEGDTLKVDYLQGWNWFWMRRMDGKDLVVMLPQAMKKNLKDLDVETVSAQVSLTGIAAGDLEVETVSGSITGRDLLADQADFNTVSGKVDAEFRSCPQYLDMESVSGRLTAGLPEGTAFTLDAQTVSGTIRKGIREKETADCHISLSTVSGSMEIRSLPLQPPASEN